MTVESKLGFTLRSINEKIRRCADKDFKKYGLTGQQSWYIIYIFDRGGKMPQKELEKAAGVSHPTVTGIVSRLRAKGFVKTETDSADRRGNVISLTKKAQTAARELKAGNKNLNGLMFASFNENDKRELERMLEIMNFNLSAHLDGEEEK